MTAFAAARIGLRRAVVVLQRDHVGLRAEMAGKVENVAHRGGAERVDRLRIVADDRQAASGRLEVQQNRGLKAVSVLVFIDQHVIEARRNIVRDCAFRHHLCPVEQEIVVIENVLFLLRFNIGANSRRSSVSHSAHHGKKRAQHFSERCSALTARE